MRKAGLLLIAALLICGQELAARPGPSFSCAKARAADERAICRSPALVRQDRHLSELYQTVLSCTGMGTRGVDREEQRAWLLRRKACGSQTACIARLYRQRIAGFEPRAAKARKYIRQNDCPGPV